MAGVIFGNGTRTRTREEAEEEFCREGDYKEEDNEPVKGREGGKLE